MFASAIPFLSKGGMQDMVWTLATGLARDRTFGRGLCAAGP